MEVVFRARTPQLFCLCITIGGLIEWGKEILFYVGNLPRTFDFECALVTGIKEIERNFRADHRLKTLRKKNFHADRRVDLQRLVVRAHEKAREREHIARFGIARAVILRRGRQIVGAFAIPNIAQQS